MRRLRLRESFRAVSQPIRCDTWITVWPESCPGKIMKLFHNCSPVRRHVRSVLLLTLLIAADAQAANLSLPTSYSRPYVAFGRYVALQGQGDAFATSEPVVVLIEASLPGLYKSAALVAVRPPGEDERSGLQVLQLAGDGTVLTEVIERYVTLRRQFDRLPLASTAITPANYKFHFNGEVKTGGAEAYVYDVTPKKRRPGLLSGQVWVDSDNGHEVMLAGYVAEMPAAGGRVDIVRDTQVIDGSVVGRVTHLAFALPRLGRAEVVITEAVLKLGPLTPPPQLVPFSGSLGRDWRDSISRESAMVERRGEWRSRD